jgi:ketosteroid isomerase-like protein
MPSAAELYREVIEAFNAREFERGSLLYTDDGRQEDKTNGEIKIGPAGRIQVYEDSIDGFSDAQTEITTLIDDGDVCYYEATYRGTHDGPIKIFGVDEPLQATGRRVEIDFAGVARSDGEKLTYSVKYYDSAAYKKQLLDNQ